LLPKTPKPHLNSLDIYLNGNSILKSNERKRIFNRPVNCTKFNKKNNITKLIFSSWFLSERTIKTIGHKNITVH